MANVFISVLAIIFLLESFWESRLFMQLSAIMRSTTHISDEEQVRVSRVMKMDRRWNLLSWILIIAIIFVPDGQSLPYLSVLCLLETVMVMRLDRVFQQYRPDN